MSTSRRPWIRISLGRWRTPAALALGFLAGNLSLLPMIAWLGDSVPPAYADVVKDVVGLFKDGMLLIIGYYFAKGETRHDPEKPL